uniref:Zinc finger piccolo-type domain-containing protein n=1 Tax=Pelusios castaneus TaxID=367368 RepID=A0A8C8SJI9_9SAUR
MGNEASLEGGEALAGAGGGQEIAAGVEADLSQLSEEERRQIAAVMSRAQGLPGGSLPGGCLLGPSPSLHPELVINHYARQPGKPPEVGQYSLSKSRTVDVLKTEQQSPGRSPSSISLRESKSRTDFKEDQKPSMMPSFLSEANPLSAVTSVVNKFNPFDLISDSDAAQEEANRKQKAVQKDQGKPEDPKGQEKHPTQPQSPKPTVQQKGLVKPAPQQAGPSKLPPQQQPGATKQASKPGPSQPEGPPSEQAKPSQQRGLQKTQSQQSESTKQVPRQQSPAKPSPHQPGPTKTLPQLPDSARASSQAPGPLKPSAQQPGPTKQPSQQPGQQAALAKPAPQQAGPAKQPSQQPGPGPGKPAPQQTGPAKQPLHQLGPTKASSQPAGPTKLPSQESGLTKLSGQQTGPGKPSQQQVTATPGESVLKKTLCPLCSSTELLLHTPEKANYNTCTQCQTIVCSMCGFNPNPHITEVSSV